MNDERRELGKAVCAALKSDDWCTAPGGGYYVKGHGFVSVAKARALTGIMATPKVRRQPEMRGAARDYNLLCMMINSVSAGRLTNR